MMTTLMLILQSATDLPTGAVGGAAVGGVTGGSAVMTLAGFLIRRYYKKRDKEEAQTAGQFAEIQRTLKMQDEAHVQSRIILEHVGTRQEDMLRRMDVIEDEVQRTRAKITDRVKAERDNGEG